MIQTAGLYLLAAASVVLLLRMLALQSRNPLLFAAALVVLAASLSALSPPRPVGNSPHYVNAARAIAHGSLPPAQGARLRGFSPYAFLAAPFLRAAEYLGAAPRTGFAAVNVLLLALAGFLLMRRASVSAAALLAAGPILWWVDKPQPDVFTFALITIAVVLLGSAPWWSIAALIAAALEHLQAFQFDAHLPMTRELLSPAFDPNIGVFVLAPFLTLALAIAVILALVRAPRQVFTPVNGGVLLLGAVFVAAFTQVANVNTGGTPGPSRLGLWLLPIAIPFLEAAPAVAASRAATAASLLWCVWMFAPARPEQYLQPTAIARVLWQRYPAVDNPLVEIFAERIAGTEPAPAPPLATPGCEKVLIVGRGSGSPTAWPARCSPSTAPPYCREPGTLCYANRAGAEYGFVKLPEMWMAPPPVAAVPGRDPIGVTPPEAASRLAGLGMTAGWSYLEASPDDEVRWRWMGDQAEIVVLPHEPMTVRLRVDTRSHGRPRRIRVSTPAGDLAMWTVPVDRAVFETGPFELNADRSVIRFDSIDGADVPADGGDRRRLSVAMFGIRVIAE